MENSRATAGPQIIHVHTGRQSAGSLSSQTVPPKPPPSLFPLASNTPIPFLNNLINSMSSILSPASPPTKQPPAPIQTREQVQARPRTPPENVSPTSVQQTPSSLPRTSSLSDSNVIKTSSTAPDLLTPSKTATAMPSSEITYNSTRSKSESLPVAPAVRFDIESASEDFETPHSKTLESNFGNSSPEISAALRSRKENLISRTLNTPDKFSSSNASAAEATPISKYLPPDSVVSTKSNVIFSPDLESSFDKSQPDSSSVPSMPSPTEQKKLPRINTKLSSVSSPSTISPTQCPSATTTSGYSDSDESPATYGINSDSATDAEYSTRCTQCKQAQKLEEDSPEHSRQSSGCDRDLGAPSETRTRSESSGGGRSTGTETIIVNAGGSPGSGATTRHKHHHHHKHRHSHSQIPNQRHTHSNPVAQIRCDAKQLAQRMKALQATLNSLFADVENLREEDERLLVKFKGVQTELFSNPPSGTNSPASSMRLHGRPSLAVRPTFFGGLAGDQEPTQNFQRPFRGNSVDVAEFPDVSYSVAQKEFFEQDLEEQQCESADQTVAMPQDTQSLNSFSEFRASALATNGTEARHSASIDKLPSPLSASEQKPPQFEL